HTEGSEDKSESKKEKKHKKKKSKSSDDKTVSTPSIEPHAETETKEKEDVPPGTVFPESLQEAKEPPINDSHQQGLTLNLESANSCMGDD
ncbi:hypothetical protein A2U01_0081004, partial [Trifolium medium]|nr:hypothetical protein [Trifolium medium]